MSISAGSGLRSSLLLATALSLGLSFGASAQGRGQDRDRDGWRGPPPIQLLHRAEARIAQLKADLRLTEEQTRHWDAFERVVIDTAKARVDRLNPKPAPEPATTTVTPPPPAVAPATDMTAKPDAAPVAPSEADKSGEVRPTPRRVEIEPRRRDADEADRMTREAEERRMRQAEERREAEERRDERRAERRGNRDRDDDRDDRRAGRLGPEGDELGLMIEMADDTAARAAELKRVAEGARPLYDSLERRQRDQLVRFIHRDYAAAPEPAPRRKR